MNKEHTKHEWDKETGIKEKSIPHIGYKGKIIRTCKVCGKKEQWSEDGIYHGWFTRSF